MCDTMVSVTDHGVLFAKNSDRDANESQLLEWVPARDHAAATTLRCTWIEIPQVDHTHAVLLSRPWWMFGAEMGANAHGVVIGNEAVFTKELAARTGLRARRSPDATAGLLGMDLLRLALERASTAAQAVEVIVTLLERYGQAGSCSWVHPRFTYDNSFLIADPFGAIVLETAGRRHATEEVRFGGRSISNGLTIPAFAAAHADPIKERVSACAARRRRTQRAAAGAGAGNGAGNGGTDPVGDLMLALRDHGPDGLPRWSPLNGALNAPCAHTGGFVTSTQTTASWVADLRGASSSGSRSPNDSGALHWVTGTAAPCTSLFAPVRVEVPVDVGPNPSDVFDPSTRWWRHEVLHRAAMVDPQALLARFAPERDLIEATWRADPPTGADAFRIGSNLTARWAADVVGAAQPEARPRHVRRHMAALDRSAALPTGDGVGSDRYRPALDATLAQITTSPTPGARP